MFRCSYTRYYSNRQYEVRSNLCHCIRRRKQALLDEFGFGNNHPIIIAGSTHKGEEETIFETFIQVLKEYPQARLLIAPREIYRGHDIQNLAKRYELSAICRSDMTEPVHEGIPVVILDTIGELGRLYSLGEYHLCRGFSCEDWGP